MPEMTLLEAAKNLERLANDFEEVGTPGNAKILRYASSILRRVASGEYAPVVHGYWVRINDTQEQMCSECGQSYDIYAYRQDDYTHCPSCGALMDGKDGKS